MALTPNEQFLEVERDDTSKRVEAHSIQPKEFAEVGTEEELPVLTPVARNTSTGKWAAWDANGANGLDSIDGFVFPDPLTLSEDGEVIGNVLMAGKIHYEDIVAAVEERAVESEADILAEMLTGLRAKGLFIYGTQAS